jgi:hypothetical protein
VLTESDKRRIFQEHVAALLREEELLRERIREEEKREDLQRLRDFEKFLRDKLKAGGITADTKWKDLRQVSIVICSLHYCCKHHCMLFTLLLHAPLLLLLTPVSIVVLILPLLSPSAMGLLALLQLECNAITSYCCCYCCSTAVMAAVAGSCH